MMPVVCPPIHHLCFISINVSEDAHAFPHMLALTDTHAQLPVWIISGFSQWVMEPVLLSPLSLTFPSELPTTVGLIRRSPNTYLSVESQPVCATITKAQVTFSPFSQTKQEMNLVMSTRLQPPLRPAVHGFERRRTQERVLLHSSRSPQLR